MSESVRKYDAWVIRKGEGRASEDYLVVETALTITLNGEPLTVTMQTPGNELVLVRGLLYTEGIWTHKSKALMTGRIEKDKLGYVTSIDALTDDGDETSVISKRSLLSVSACGICGKTDIRFPSGKSLRPAWTELKLDLSSLFAAMQTQQKFFALSGGCHAAAAFDQQGNLLCTFEDIGRHNAVDKVVGNLLNAGELGRASVLTVSGRVSYEIVAKSFAAGIPVIAAVSSVSSLAVDYSKELGITLVGFCREGRATIYSHPDRLF